MFSQGSDWRSLFFCRDTTHPASTAAEDSKQFSSTKPGVSERSEGESDRGTAGNGSRPVSLKHYDWGQEAVTRYETRPAGTNGSDDESSHGRGEAGTRFAGKKELKQATKYAATLPRKAWEIATDGETFRSRLEGLLHRKKRKPAERPTTQN
jgi:hypothetical protein